MTSNVLIVGSINIDCSVRVEKLVRPGETIRGSEPQFLAGGKGGNQAVSVSANHGRAFMIGGVGSDDHGKVMLESLVNSGVDCSGVKKYPGSTGTAFIFVEDGGENAIIVTAGANAKVAASDVDDSVRRLAGNKPIILCQMELPYEIVQQSSTLATELGGRFVLNLAPAAEISSELLSSCDPLILNESEASFVVSREIDSVEQALVVAKELASLSKSCVITLGANGAVFSNGEYPIHVPGESVAVVDTTGAGDAFVGALVSALSFGAELHDAVLAGVRAGSKAVGHFGAQAPKL